MIKTNELRIGNWVTESDGRLVRIHDGFGIDHAAQFLPIPLTPEILDKAGFKKKNSYYENEYIKLTKEGTGFVMFTSLSAHESEESRILNYLHQLQNLHFDWTGEELKFNYEQTNSF